MVALWLALRTTSRYIDATFVWEAASSYQPTLLVQNTSTRIVVLESIEVWYCNTQVCMVDMAKEFKFAKYSILEAGQTMKIPMATVKCTFPTIKRENTDSKSLFGKGQVQNGFAQSNIRTVNYKSAFLVKNSLLRIEP